jgi:hypothetical protein
VKAGRREKDGRSCGVEQMGAKKFVHVNTNLLLLLCVFQNAPNRVFTSSPLCIVSILITYARSSSIVLRENRARLRRPGGAFESPVFTRQSIWPHAKTSVLSVLRRQRAAKGSLELQLSEFCDSVSLRRVGTRTKSCTCRSKRVVIPAHVFPLLGARCSCWRF